MKDKLKVHSIHWYSDEVFELQLERDDITFQPGDCLALFGEDGEVSRPYSCASGMNDEALRFVIRKMQGGVVSSYLSERKAGDLVKVSPPFGWFRPGQVRDEAPFVFIATGTGISPFLAWLRSHPEQPPVKCLYGVRKLADAVELGWLQQVCPLELAVSREESAGSFHGRVTGLLDRIPLEPSTHFYLCGLDAMIDDVSIWLEEKGVEITRIHRECFFNASYAT